MRFLPFRPLVLLWLTTVAQANAPTPAVMFRGDAAHQGRYDAAPVTTLPVAKWKVTLEGNIFSSPVVSGDHAYLGSGGNRFYALKTATGAVAWMKATRGAVHSSPAVADGTVYFGDAGGMFYALDAASGAEKWTFQVQGERRFGAKGLHGAPPPDRYFDDDWDFFLSTPALCGDGFIFCTADGHVYCVR